ncbi:hypothetical protein DD237_006488 [Peronospora effusa]|uniref:Uncharacterized protein n=1 Tax=Peronospora effusa TaxID=542832 RepID=A0A425BY87_9STRA|nr:hypothetical protein DD237_006488 [Peronospora effusa]
MFHPGEGRSLKGEEVAGAAKNGEISSDHRCRKAHGLDADALGSSVHPVLTELHKRRLSKKPQEGSKASKMRKLLKAKVLW